MESGLVGQSCYRRYRDGLLTGPALNVSIELLKGLLDNFKGFESPVFVPIRYWRRGVRLTLGLSKNEPVGPKHKHRPRLIFGFFCLPGFFGLRTYGDGHHQAQRLLTFDYMAAQELPALVG